MTTKNQWVLFTALGTLAILVAGYMLLVRPQHSQAASIDAQTTTVQGQVTSLRAQLAQLQEESRNLAAQQAALAGIAQQLPSQPQEPTLLRSLQQAATSTGVDLTTLTPGPPVAFTGGGVAGGSATAGRTAAGGTAVGGTAAGGTAAGLLQIPVALTVTGGYFQMERFLDTLEGLRRSMLVNSFGLNVNGGGQSSSSTSTAPTVGKGEITASISAMVFMSTTPIGAAAGAAPANQTAS